MRAARRYALATFAAALAIGGVTGCSTAQAGGSHPSVNSASKPTGSKSGTGTALPKDLPSFDVPFAAYELDGADLYTMQEAQFQLANDCTRRFGFAVKTPTLDRDAMVAEQAEANARLYGITSLVEARTHGYQPAVVPGASQADAMPTQSASYQFVFTGSRTGSVAPPPGGWKSPGTFGGLTIPPGGCLGEARTKLWGSPDSQIKDALAQDLRIRAYQQSQSDPKVQQVLGQWASCMASRGYHYQTPLDPRFPRDPSTAPSPDEINAAVADIGCKQQTGLLRVWNRADVLYQHQAIEKNQLALTEEHTKIQAALRRAAEVLNGNG